MDYSEEGGNAADTGNTSIEDSDTTEIAAEERTEDSAGEEETSTGEEETVITAPAEQESFSTDSMNPGQAADEEVVASGSCGENAA